MISMKPIVIALLMFLIALIALAHEPTGNISKSQQPETVIQ